MTKIIIHEPVAASSVRPYGGIPRELDRLLERMLAKDPDERPQDAGAVVGAIDALGQEPTENEDDDDPWEEADPFEEETLSVVMAAVEGHGAQDALQARVEALGSRAERLADGATVVVTIAGRDVSHPASEAARCALEMKAAVPDARVVVATGAAGTSSGGGISDVIERTAAKLDQRTRSQSGVHLDWLTADLLDDRFEVDRRSSGGQLRAYEESDD